MALIVHCDDWENMSPEQNGNETRNKIGLVLCNSYLDWFILLEILRAVIPMSRKKYTVDLTEDQRDKLENFISSGVHRTQEVTRARILLKVDEDWTDKGISEALDCGVSTVKRMRERFTEDGIAAIHRRDPDRDYERKLDGEDEAHLIALANREPPDGRARWTLRLLADKLVTLDEINHESVSHQTVHEVLKKRATASPIQTMGDSAGPRYRLHLSYGGRPLALPRTIRSRPASRLFRRASDTVDQARQGTAPGPAGHGCPRRLPLRAQRNQESVSGV